MDLMVMRALDSIYTACPFYGRRRMVVELKQRGYVVNRKRISRLMTVMGLEVIYPKSSSSERHPSHKIYPYLLRGVEIEHVHQVWGVDITYLPMKKGFLIITL